MNKISENLTKIKPRIICNQGRRKENCLTRKKELNLYFTEIILVPEKVVIK